MISAIPCRLRSGFSLVELSIVLVILGLLVGGVLTGQSLIRASELRKFMNTMERYKAATYTFRDKYFALPGDMNNAKQFWGSAGTGTACRGVDSTTLADPKNTCDGDGDGNIRPSSVNNYSWEIFRYWQHLANAGLIEGSYTGITSGGGAQMGHSPGWNSPSVAVGNNGGWMMNSYLDGEEPINLTSFETVNYGHSFVIGSTANSNFVPRDGLIPAPDMLVFGNSLSSDGSAAASRPRVSACLVASARLRSSSSWVALRREAALSGPVN